MNPMRRASLRAAAAPLITAALAGCSFGGSTSSTTQPAASPTAAADSTRSVRIVLRTDESVAMAMLANTPQAAQFAAMLPVQLTLRDPMGQAKSGQLARRIDVTGAEPTRDPSVVKSTTGPMAPSSRSSMTTSANPPPPGPDPARERGQRPGRLRRPGTGFRSESISSTAPTPDRPRSQTTNTCIAEQAGRHKPT